MLGNFVYHNPTKLYFGPNSIRALEKELPAAGPVVMLSYGMGSVKRYGLYEELLKYLEAAGKTVVDDGGVMPNPTIGRLREGCEKVREHKVDLILAVGGGSVIDYAKAVAAGAYCPEDVWDYYWVRHEKINNKVVPYGAVLTMVGTGSEMNGSSVIMNLETKAKVGHTFPPEAYPRFSIMDPTYTLTLPHYQMVSGCFDIMSHILEQYLSGTDDNTSDYLAEGLMRSVIHSSRVAAKDPQNYEARSNLMWSATWALNTLISRAKPTDWMVHKFGHAVSVFTDGTHGMTLAACSLAYYRTILDAGLPRFARFARTVWGVSPEGKTEREQAEEGLKAMEAWMRELGLVMRLREFGVTEEMIPELVKSTPILNCGYRELSPAEVEAVFRASL